MNNNNSNQINALVVDDDLLMRSVISEMLNKLGFENVETASNGQIALGKLVSAEKPYGLIVCDLNMPEMDGVEFMRLAKDSEFSGNIILVSGEDKRLLEIAYDLGAAQNLNILGALSKPPTLPAMEELVANLVSTQPEKRHTFPHIPISKEDLELGLNGDGDELLLYYQPVVHIPSGEVTGVESLARWNHPSRGILGPETFIDLAEAHGLMDSLSRKIFEMAARQALQWVDQKLFLKTSINFSLNSFANPDFVRQLLELTDKIAIEPKYLMLEIGEGQVMDDELNCMESLMRLRFKKFGLTLDDFGSRNSSLAQLKSIPFTEFKLDRSFVHGAVKNSATRSVLESCISLAKKLDMEIVAKGVENREDWDLVESLGCDSVQGSFCSEPLSSEDLEGFIDSWQPPVRPRD